MRRRTIAAVFLILLTAVLAGCGGGSSDSTPAGTSGIAVDPYINGASFQEILEGGTPGQLSTLSDDLGRFTFAAPLSAGSQVIMVTPGFHTGVAYDGKLRSCVELIDGELVVSPFTTVLTNLMESGLTEEEAKRELLDMLDTAGHTLLVREDLTTDPMAGVSDGGPLQRLRGAMAVNGWLQAMNGFEVDPNEDYPTNLRARQQLLSDMSGIMNDYLGEGNFDTIRGSLEEELPVGSPPVSVDDMIRAATTICSFLADLTAEDLQDGTIDGDMTTLIGAGYFEEAVMRHYAGRNTEWYRELRDQNPELPEIPSGGGFTMGEMSDGNMMGDWNQDGTWGMGSGGGRWR